MRCESRQGRCRSLGSLFLAHSCPKAKRTLFASPSFSRRKMRVALEEQAHSRSSNPNIHGTSMQLKTNDTSGMGVLRGKQRPIKMMFGENTPFLGRNVKLGNNVLFGPGVIVYDNVSIGDNTVVGPNVILGEPLMDSYGSGAYRNPRTLIGSNSVIRSGTVIYAGCSLGPNLSTGHYAVIRERTSCGRSCSFGTFSACDGDVVIGDRCRFHYHTFISKRSRIGDDVWMFPDSGLYDDLHPPCGRCLEGPTISDRVVIGAGAIVLPKVKVGQDAVIAAGSVVTRDVRPGVLVAGCPARVIKASSQVECETGLVRRPYPWTRHYRRPGSRSRPG